MYKKTAKATQRKMMKTAEYAPSLATLYDKHDKSQWSAKTINRAISSTKKRRKNFGNYMFGMKFR